MPVNLLEHSDSLSSALAKQSSSCHQLQLHSCTEHSDPAKAQKVWKGQRRVVGAQAVQGCHSTWSRCWWLLSAVQTVVRPEITGQDSPFQLLRRELTKHLNLALKSRWITELEHDLWGEYSARHYECQGAWPIPNWAGFVQLYVFLPEPKSDHLRTSERWREMLYWSPGKLWALGLFLWTLPVCSQLWGLQPPQLQSSAGCTRWSCFLWGSWSPVQCLTQTPVDAFSSAFSKESYPMNASQRIQGLD